MYACSCITDHNSWTIFVVSCPYWGHAATNFSKCHFGFLSDGNIYQISADLITKNKFITSASYKVDIIFFKFNEYHSMMQQ